MPGRTTFARSQQFREWIESAISDGAESPARILEWIEKHKSRKDAPSLATISRIMTEEMGYKKIEKRYEKGD
jgi:hypothetical protein